MAPVLEMRDTWTFADLQAELARTHGALDDVDWRRYEIVDGALVVRPSTTPFHEFVSEAIRATIRASLPPNTSVIGPVGVDLGRSYRIPDLVVVPNHVFACDAALLDPSEVVLAVEVVSPGSRPRSRSTSQSATSSLRRTKGRPRRSLVP